MLIENWHRLEDWLSAHEPLVRADLNPPATEAQIRELEGLVDMRLPDAFSECLLAHDGQRGRAEWLFSGKEFLSTRVIAMTWAGWNTLLAAGDFGGRSVRSDPGIEETWFSPRWLPFAANGGGDLLCLDLAPAPVGTHGQVIAVYHDLPDRKLICPGFGDWFANFVRTMTSR